MEKCFIDPSIVCYSINKGEPEKQQVARKLMDDLIAANAAQISTQVVQEFISFATDKLRMPKDITQKLVDSLTEIFSVYIVNTGTIKRALKISIEAQIPFLDSLNLCAASESRCAIIYSENLPHGQVIDGVKIVNPFLKEA